MATEILERPRVQGPGTGSGDQWKIIVLNDSHNTFDGVATALAQVLPGVNFEQGMQHASTIHARGQAIVWTGIREIAELYHEQLVSSGLTMAPLEQ